MKKKLFAVGLAAIVGTIGIAALAGCGGNKANANDPAADITRAVARESASGTRGAFDELVENKDGKTIDDALGEGKPLASCVEENNNTAGVITSVAQAYGKIGYVSLGSYLVNTDTVQALKVEGVEATTANVLNGSYKLSRPFNICYQDYDKLSDLAKNLIDYIESEAGQKIIGEDYINLPEGTGEGQVEIKDYTPYAGTETSLQITGSTSVGPLMKELVEAFEKANPNNKFTITITENGSGEGIKAAQDNEKTIGMASRALKAEELETLTGHQIATDGIAVIAKKGSEVENVTFDQLYNLYMNGTPIVVGEED